MNNNDQNTGTSTIAAITIGAIGGAGLTEFVPDIAQWFSCGGSIAIGRTAAEEPCSARAIRDATLIGLMVAGIAAIIAAAIGHARGRLTVRQAYQVIAATLLGALLSLLKAAAIDKNSPDLTDMHTAIAIHISCIALFVALAWLAPRGQSFALIVRVGLALLIGFAVGLLLQGAAPVAVGGLSALDRWPEFIVDPSATVGGGAAFAAAIVGLRATAESPRRSLAVLLFLAIAVSLAVAWAAIDYTPSHWADATVSRTHYLAICGAILLPAVVCAAIARVSAQEPDPLALMAWLAAAASAVPALSIWLASASLRPPVAAERLPALLLTQAATPLAVVASVALALALGRRLISDRS